MIQAILSFLGIFLLIAIVGLFVFQGETLKQRIAEVINRNKPVEKRPSAMEKTGAAVGAVVEKLERVIPKSEKEVGVMRQRLIRAGFRSENAVSYFYGSKVLVALILCMIVAVTGIGKNNVVILYLVCLGIGYIGPDFWLGKMIGRRQSKIRRGLPDVLDLLVICVEAGLGLDQALARTVTELKETHPALADELGIVVLEQRAGRSRAEAWRGLAERTDVDVIRNVVTMLIQAEQFGTSIGKTLRTHSETLRTQRVQTVEEMAAKTTVKLIFPLALFIFPCLFVVMLGPAVIIMSESFQQYLTH